MASWLPKDYPILDVDWDLQRKILPERFIVRLDANLLDRHTYDSIDNIKEGSPESYEITKDKARKMIPLFPGIPVQTYHGTDGINAKTGFLNSHVGRSVIGKVARAWIPEDNDRELLCEIKLNNNKVSSLIWNWSLFNTEAISGASLHNEFTYNQSWPKEVSLAEHGMKPNTGVIAVIDKDGQITNFKEYKLKHLKQYGTPSNPITPVPVSAAVPEQQQQEQPVIIAPAVVVETEQQPSHMATHQPKHPVTGKFITVAEAQALGVASTTQQQQQPVPPFVQAPTQTSASAPVVPYQQQQQAMSVPTTSTINTAVMPVDPVQQYAVPGTFTTPVPPDPRYPPTTKEYNMDANFNGVPHTSMVGGPLHQIAQQEFNRYQQEQAERTQMANNQVAFAEAITKASGGMIKMPPEMQQLKQQQMQLQQMQQQQQQQQAASAAAASGGDVKMEDTHPTAGQQQQQQQTQEESSADVDQWFSSATPDELQKVNESAERKIMTGRVNEMTKREALVHADHLLKSKKEKKEATEKLLETSKEQKLLMQTFVSALSALKPTTAEEHKAMEGLNQANTPTETISHATRLIAAAGSRFASMETQNQLYQQMVQQQQKQSIPRHLQHIADQYAAMSTTSSSSHAPAPTHSFQQQQPRYTAPTHAPAPAPTRALSYKDQCDIVGNLMAGKDSFDVMSNYLPTSSPGYSSSSSSYPMQHDSTVHSAVASSRHGMKRAHDSNQPPEEEKYFDPNKSTRVDADWLHDPQFARSFTPALKQSFHLHGKGLDSWGEPDKIPFHLIAPTFTKIQNERALATLQQQQQQAAMSM